MSSEIDVIAELRIHDLTKFKISSNEAQPEKEKTSDEYYAKMKVDYAATGIRQTVKGVMVTNCNNHPHVLLLKNKDGSADGMVFQLPGGVKKPGESDQTAINRTLNKLFSRRPKPRPWEVKDLVTQWWRPRFDGCQFPYQPAHCTKPVELARWLLINLPDEWEGAEWEFFVPENYKLVAVPLFQLYKNVDEYGPQISTLPHQLGRFTMHTA